MSTITTASKSPVVEAPASIAGNPDAWFAQKFDEHMQRREAAHVPSMAMVVTKGTLDWAYPPFILASMATSLMKKTISNKGVATIEELRELCLEAEVKMIACQMTVDLFGFDQDEFMDEVKEWVGAASFLPTAQKADVTLFI